MSLLEESILVFIDSGDAAVPNMPGQLFLRLQSVLIQANCILTSPGKHKHNSYLSFEGKQIFYFDNVELFL